MTESASNTNPIRQALTGPIASVRTPFNRDGSIDFDGVRRVIDFNLDAGSKATLVTAGDSHFTCMSDEEKAAVNRVAIEHTAGRALVVACDWEFATPQAVDCARTCADLGADMIMVRPPDWANSCTVDTLVEHYAAVAEIMPVMLVTNLFKERPTAFALDTIARVRDTVPNVRALKDDLQGDFARKACLLVHTSWAILSGGGLRNHMNMHPYGCDGFMDRHMNFAPRISHRYWDAVRAGALGQARSVIQDIEIPLEDFMGTFPGGRDAAMHGLLEIVEIAGRWRRPPYHSLTDKEMVCLKDFVNEMGLP